MEKIKSLINKIDKRYLIILIIALAIFIPYMSNQFIKGDDYICHVANIFSMDKNISLKEFNLIPSAIHPVMAHDFGYANGIFYPQLSYIITTYIYGIIKIFGGTLIASVKVFEFFTILLSGISMYIFTKKTFKDKDVGVISAILYMAAPYFVSDVFIRMAYTEMLTFIFIPIVMTAIVHILNQDYKKFIIYFTIGYSGMIYSHLVMTVFFTIIVAIVLLINIKKLLNKKAILSFLLATAMVLGITASFWVPMLEHKLCGDYVVFSDNTMSNINKLSKNQLGVSAYIKGLYDKEISYYISYASIALIGVGIFNFKKIKEKLDKNQKLFLIATAIITIVSFIITSKILNWEKIPKVFWLIQFPWRMCTFIVFGISLIASMALIDMKKIYKRIALVFVCIICIWDSWYVIHKNNLEEVDGPKYESVYSTENRAMGGQKEYLPVKAKKNIKYLEKRSDEVIVKEGNANIDNVKNKTPYLEFEIKIENSEEAVLEIPRVFYLGYEIKIETEDGKNERIDYYENDKGFIEFKLNKSGKIKANYTGTTLGKISNIIVFGTVCGLIFLIYKSKKDSKGNKENIKESKGNKNE